MKKLILSICFLLMVFGNLYLLCAGPVIFYTDRDISPGKVYYLTGGVERQFYQAPSGWIFYCAFGNDGILYFSDANNNKVYRCVNGETSIVYQHTTYVKDVAVHPDGRVYFSESSGADGSGIIYRLVDGAAQIYYTVDLSDVKGFWGGNFAFDSAGTLYLSTGNRIGSSIYKVLGRIPMPIYNDPAACIAGFDFDNTGMIYYANWHHMIYKLNPLTGARTEYRNDGSHSFADVSIMKHYIALGPEAGRVNRVVVHPTNANILYAGTSSGGVFRSYNAGETWFLSNDGVTDPQIGGLLVYPPNPNIIITVSPSGIFRSTNSGLSWNRVLSTPRPFPSPEMTSLINSMQKSPIRYDSATGMLYAAPFGNGLYQSQDAGIHWVPIFGADILESKNRTVMDIEIAPEDGGALYISTLSGIKKYNGSTWDAYGSEIASATPAKVLSPICIRVSPSSPQRIYVTAADLQSWPLESDLWRRNTVGGLFSKTTIGATPWVSWSAPESLTINPTNASQVWFGGVNAFISSNSGGAWTNLNTAYACGDSTVCGVDYRDIFYDSTGNRLYGAHDQGIFRYDFGAGSIRAIEKGLINTQFYDLDIGPVGTVYGGTQDTGAFRKRIGMLWEKIPTEGSGDVLDILANPTDDSKLFIRTNAEQLVIASNYGNITSTSSGLAACGFWNHQLVFISSSNTLYAGTRFKGVYKSINGGVSFTPANTGISSLDIRCLDNRPGSDQVVFAGTLKNGLYKTTNGGMSWERLLNFPDVAALSLNVLADGNTVYAGTSNGVYVSTDGGATWIAKNNGLPNRKMVSEFVIDPMNPTCFYAGLGYYSLDGLYGGGVYWTSNSGDNWAPLSSSKTRNMSVTSIRFDPNDSSSLWVATYGSGVINLFKE